MLRVLRHHWIGSVKPYYCTFCYNLAHSECPFSDFGTSENKIPLTKSMYTYTSNYDNTASLTCPHNMTCSLLPYSYHLSTQEDLHLLLFSSYPNSKNNIKRPTVDCHLPTRMDQKVNDLSLFPPQCNSSYEEYVCQLWCLWNEIILSSQCQCPSKISNHGPTPLNFYHKFNQKDKNGATENTRRTCASSIDPRSILS